jgi:hypothetical protein
MQPEHEHSHLALSHKVQDGTVTRFGASEKFS